MEKAILLCGLFGLTKITLSLIVLIIILLVLLNWLEKFSTKRLFMEEVWLLTLLVQAKELLFTDRLLLHKGGWSITLTLWRIGRIAKQLSVMFVKIQLAISWLRMTELSEKFPSLKQKLYGNLRSSQACDSA